MRMLIVAVVAALGCSLALAASKGTQFWNLTANTITNFQLAPAGSDAWGKNQCLNDPDKSVDHDERLKLTDVKTGLYDVRFTDAKGRSCTLKNISIKENAVFSIDEKQLKNCTK